MKKRKVTTIATDVVATVIAAAVSAFTLHVFVFANDFAPSGVDGIATMLQKTTGLSAGVYSLILNAPLVITAFFIINKKYVFYTVAYTALSSVTLMILNKVGFYQYVADSEKLLAAIFSGLLLGVRTGLMIKIGASTGGVDILAYIVQKKRPYFNIERIISIFCYVTIFASFFVYHNLNSLLLAIVQMFIFEQGVNAIMKDSRDAVEFKIVTKHPEELKKDIIYVLKHGATIIESKGMFTETESYTIVSIVNSRQVPEFLNILKKYPDSFVSYSKILGVRGNFRWKKTDQVK